MQNLVFQNKRNFLKIGIFIFPIIFIIITQPDSAIFESDDYSHQLFIIEDGPIETASSVSYLLSSIFSILISALFFQKEKKLFGIFYVILAVFFIFFFLEEISWGQRIFEIQTPEPFSVNTQIEINIHNFPGTSIFQVYYFIIIGIYGTFGWILFYIKPIKKYNFFVKYFTPQWYIATFFISGFAWYILKFPITHEEINEFLVSAGILCFILVIFSRLKLDLKDIKSEKRKEKISIKRNLILITIIVIIFPTFTLISVYLSDQHFVLTSLHGNDLSNFDLTGVDFSGRDLTGTILTGANLANANLAGADLSGNDLSGTILTGANMANAILTGVNLSGKDFSGTILTGAILHKSNLSNTNLSGMDLSFINFNLADLSNSDLSFAKLEGILFHSTNLSGANLSESIMNYTYFSYADLSNANLSGAKIKQSRIQEIPFFNNAYMAELPFDHAVNEIFLVFYEKNVFSVRVLDYSVKGNDLIVRYQDIVYFAGANFEDSNLTNINFQDSVLIRADFTNANLLNSTLENAYLDGAKLDCLNHPICN